MNYTGVYPGMVSGDSATIDLAGQSSPTITMDAARNIGSLTLSNSGTLTISGANALTVGSAVSVASGQTLQGSGTLNAALTLSAVLAGTLNVGGNVVATGATFSPTAGATLPIGGSLASDSASVYNFSVGTTSSKITAGSISGTLGGTVNLAAATGFGIGSYNLITPPTGAWGSAPAVSLSSGTVPTTLLTYAYSASTSAITLTTARSATMGAFNWTGGATGNWSPWANWQVGGVSYAGVYPGMVGADTVTIDLTAQSSPTITMDAALSVASLTLNNAGTLTLNGANALTVSSALSIGASQTVQGSGTINGPVTVAGGTINGAAWGGSVGMSSGSISGGAFSAL